MTVSSLPQPLAATPAPRTERWLTVTGGARCPSGNGERHRATALLDRCNIDPLTADTYLSGMPVSVDMTDRRWPSACAGCGARFPDDSRRFVLCLPLLTLADGREVTVRDAPEGTWWVGDPTVLDTDGERPGVTVIVGGEPVARAVPSEFDLERAINLAS